MDKEFFESLETAFTNVGSKEVWKCQIGDALIWFSPISTTGQQKTNDTLSSEELGTSAIYESKKVTLARSIVGINNIDLRPYLKSGPILKVKLDSGEELMDVHRYILTKMADWGAEWVDVAFDKCVDLFLSYKRKLLNGITFENKQDPKEELAELEDKVAALRDSLGMPRLVEWKSDMSGPSHNMNDDASDDREPAKNEEDTNTGFHPFEAISVSSEKQDNISKAPFTSVKPAIPVPVVNQPLHDNRSNILSQAESSIDNPFNSLPSVSNDDIVERQSSREPLPPPVIDRPNLNRNPRFRPTR